MYYACYANVLHIIIISRNMLIILNSILNRGNKNIYVTPLTVDVVDLLRLIDKPIQEHVRPYFEVGTIQNCNNS